MTLATNPVKFYEYISAGKPVVSIKLPELLPYAKYCYLADGKKQFKEMIPEALNENNQNLKNESEDDSDEESIDIHNEDSLKYLHPLEIKEHIKKLWDIFL